MMHELFHIDEKWKSDAKSNGHVYDRGMLMKDFYGKQMSI